MDFFRRKKRKREHYHGPPEPSEEIRRAVSDAATTAELQLERAESRDEEVSARTERLNKIRRENALGARFWQAAGTPRS